MKFVISLFLLIIVVGCSRNNNNLKDIKKEVVIWAHEGQPYEKKALASIIENFNKSQQDIKAIIDFKQEQGYGNRLNAAALAKSLPDIIEIDGPYTAQFAATNILAPIKKYFSSEFINDFYDSIIIQGTYNSELYTLGSFESTVVVFFNKDITEACNISPPTKIEKAWLWEEFILALKKIKKCNPQIMPLETFIVWGGEWMTYAFTPIIWSNEGSILSPEKTKSQGFFNGKNSIKALEGFQYLFKSQLSDPNKPDGQFANGKAAFAWGVFNRFPIYKNINFGMMPLPYFKKKASPSGSWSFGIAKTSNKKKEAAKVLEWMLSPNNGIIPMVEANSGIPSRRTATKIMKQYKKSRGLFIEQIENTARPRPTTPQYGMLTNIVSRALLDITKGENVENTLNRAAKEIDKNLK